MFYGFPEEKKLRSCWLHKISRKNFSPSTGHWVCSLHFEGGKKTYMNNVPVIFPLPKSHLRPSPKPRRKHVLTGPSTSSQEAPPTAISAASSTKETDESEVGGTQQQIERLREKLQNVPCLNESLQHDLSIFKFGLRRFKDSDKVLADNYNPSVSEVSRIFASWLDLLYSKLIQLPVWATKKTIKETMPEVFQQKYPITRVILDCTELFIEKPSCFRAQSDTYSTYKSHNTAKGLVGIAPNGVLTFVSDLYGGHCSDKIIFEHCGILQLLEEGDSVMADRGFKIQALLAPRKVYLNIPPFMRSKDQLNPDEEDETREIASVRIHVERAIERVKNCNILKQILPEDIDKIWKVCCLLANFKGPLVV